MTYIYLIYTVTYSAYIKKDYKPVVRRVAARPWYFRRVVLSGCLLGSTLIISAYSLHQGSGPRPVQEPRSITGAWLMTDNPAANEPATAAAPLQMPETTANNKQPAPAWQAIRVQKGDNLSIIFDRLGLGPAVLQQILSLGGQTRRLRELMPGDSVHVLVKNGALQALDFAPDLRTKLEIVRQDKGFASHVTHTQLLTRTRSARGMIDSSLFLAGQHAGLSDNLIMQLAAIFAWDIDFALDIRKGDQFHVIYVEKYRGDIKVSEGPILAAEFVNHHHAYRALRYTSANGRVDYFNPRGASMRKAFLRTPLNFSRISSGFSLHRKHPVLNRIRAHKGVDYAAPMGTPVKATGDGKVILAARKGGYGKTVILKHGGARTTLYAHLSRFSRNISRGKRVKQGQLIGYVGKSGLATGPHLHYEFRVNGVHRNPLTVTLPTVSGIAKKYIDDFKQQTAAMLAQLDQNNVSRPAADNPGNNGKKSVIALDDTALTSKRVH